MMLSEAVQQCVEVYFVNGRKNLSQIVHPTWENGTYLVVLNQFDVIESTGRVQVKGSFLVRFVMIEHKENRPGTVDVNWVPSVADDDDESWQIFIDA